MNIQLKTKVDGNYRKIIRLFDRKLFEALKPSYGKMEIIEFTGSNCQIEIDGGVTNKNANALIEAGANVLVAGSYVFGAENPTETIADLKNTIG